MFFWYMIIWYFVESLIYCWYSQCWLQEASAYRLVGVQQSPERSPDQNLKGSGTVPNLETVCKSHNPFDARLIGVHDRDLGYECPKHCCVQERPNMCRVHWNLNIIAVSVKFSSGQKIWGTPGSEPFRQLPRAAPQIKSLGEWSFATAAADVPSHLRFPSFQLRPASTLAHWTHCSPVCSEVCSSPLVRGCWRQQAVCCAPASLFVRAQKARQADPLGSHKTAGCCRLHKINCVSNFFLQDKIL